jgi:hypothetical protein
MLERGAEWAVRFRVLGLTRVSRSRVSVLGPVARRFSYRSQSDDGNPSYSDWEWPVEPDRNGSTVSVTVDLRPATFWRKHLLEKVRRRMLRKEMRASLEELGTAAERLSVL